VELKAIKDLDPVHFAVVRSYMKAMNVDSGLLLNFATMPLTVKRVGREHPTLS
jgi:GxxExxY protein